MVTIMSPKNTRPILAGTTRKELADFAKAHHLQSFRANQIAEWLYKKLECDPDRMTNLPQPLRETLKSEFAAPSSEVVTIDRAADDTEKLLLKLSDGETIEMVIIPSSDRITFCLSTQVGCPVRCRFCASGADGLVRNLAAGEIIEELLAGATRIGRLPDNIVFMGIGEGLLNFNELAKALTLLSSPDGFGMSPRRLTVSTSGIVPGIAKLAELGKEYTLAISLHAVDDPTRAKLIPDNVRYPVAEILAAADAYRESAGRMVTLEYTLLDGINDSPQAARELGRISRTHHAKVNLIPYNATGSEFKRPPRKTIEQFAETVERSGGTVTIRRERGSEKTAACGQLRREKQKGQ